MTEFLADEGGLIITRGTGTNEESLSINDAKEISSYTDSASSSDKSFLWNKGYESLSSSDQIKIEGPVIEAGDYKIVVWFSNASEAFGAINRQQYRGTVKVYYTHSGGSESVIENPDGSDRQFKPWSWRYSGTQYGEADYAGNEDDGSSGTSFQSVGPWKIESPEFTVTDADENIVIRISPVAAGFFVSALQVNKQ